MNKDIKYTKDFYEEQDNVKRYSDAVDNVGLWNSEEIIFEKYIKNTDIIEESDKTKEFAGNTVFWIIKKK